MRYSEFRQRFAEISRKAGSVNLILFRLPIFAAYATSIVLSSAVLATIATRAYPQLDDNLAALLIFLLTITLNLWRAYESALWTQEDNRYLSAGPSRHKRNSEEQRELLLANHALKILEEERVSEDVLKYLHSASFRASEFSQKQRTFLGGLLVVAAGWFSVILEVEISAFIDSMSGSAKAAIVASILTGVVACNDFFFRLRFSNIHRTIENTLYDIMHLKEYTPPKPPNPPKISGASQQPHIEGVQTT